MPHDRTAVKNRIELFLRQLCVAIGGQGLAMTTNDHKSQQSLTAVNNLHSMPIRSGGDRGTDAQRQTQRKGQRVRAQLPATFPAITGSDSQKVTAFVAVDLAGTISADSGPRRRGTWRGSGRRLGRRQPLGCRRGSRGRDLGTIPATSYGFASRAGSATQERGVRLRSGAANHPVAGSSPTAGATGPPGPTRKPRW